MHKRRWFVAQFLFRAHSPISQSQHHYFYFILYIFMHALKIHEKLQSNRKKERNQAYRCCLRRRHNHR